MAHDITRAGKHVLQIESPVMAAAGILGFGDQYRDLIKLEKLGAFVTNPVTYMPWSPASGTRVVPLDGGVLMHTGLPNPGISKVMGKYRTLWKELPMPVIVHVVVTSIEHVRKCASRIEAEDAVDALELGLSEENDWKETEQIVAGAVRNTEKPVLVRIPLQDPFDLAQAAAQAGAGAIVACAPPRGTARDPLTGGLVSGRVYGPLVKPLVLRVVGQLAEKLDVPVIGAGGIHSPEDARDYVEAGAGAVQVDSVTWLQPKMLEIIARDLGGMVITRRTGALGDEWFPGMGDTDRKQEEEAKRKREEDSKQTPTGNS
jgi:dihydroorotate dehydrogenase (NAD+) catalytic subunit